jgi:hypothetical protein
MIVYQAFRYELDPTNVQRGRLASHAGGARYAWNWALEQVKTALQARATGDGKASVPNAMELHRMWNVWKKQPGNCAWWSENSKCAYQEAFRDLDRACKAYWRARRVGRRVGFPKLKKKGRADHFRLTDPVRVQPHAVVLPRIGAIRTKEATTKLQGRILSATCRREACGSFAALTGQSRESSRAQGVERRRGWHSPGIIAECAISAVTPSTKQPLSWRGRSRLSSWRTFTSPGWPATVASPAVSLTRGGQSSKTFLPTRPPGMAASSFLPLVSTLPVRPALAAAP